MTHTQCDFLQKVLDTLKKQTNQRLPVRKQKTEPQGVEVRELTQLLRCIPGDATMLTAPSGPTSPGFAVPGYRHEATARRLPAGKAVPGRNLHDTAGKRRDSHCTGGEAASVRTPELRGATQRLHGKQLLSHTGTDPRLDAPDRHTPADCEPGKACSTGEHRGVLANSTGHSTPEASATINLLS